LRLVGSALLVMAVAGNAAGEIRETSFQSPSLGREVQYVVELPDSYATGEGRYPVLYVLHGLFEGPGFWKRRGLSPILHQAEEEKDVPELIVVAVDGGNSFFANGPTGRFEDLVTRDIVDHVESTYRVEKGRQGRALLGISMGGYAALRIALEHPEAFAAVAAHSAMVLEEIPSAAEGAGRWHMAAFHQVFGDPIDPELWRAADPLSWVGSADKVRLPALYFDCGSEDRYRLYEGNQELHRRLEAAGIPHQFTLAPGDHGYEFVRSRLRESLSFLGRRLRSADHGPSR
jgi:S-formylglutathione hydrolase FrmB